MAKPTSAINLHNPSTFYFRPITDVTEFTGNCDYFTEFGMKIGVREGLPGGSMFPCSQQNFPCVPVFPKSISSIWVFPVP